MAWLTWVLAWCAPVVIPVSGTLTGPDGLPLEGARTVTFTVYGQGTSYGAIWTGTSTVAFDGGAFTAALEGGTPALDSALFRDHADLRIGMTLQGDVESALVPIGAAPLAAYADLAGDAAHADVASAIDGVLPASNLPSTVAYTDAPQTFASSVTAASFSGSGAGLTSIPASAITGLETALTGYLPKAGGALTGALTGTTGAFSGAMTAASFSGSGAGLTGIPQGAVTGLSSSLAGYLPLSGGTMTGALTAPSATFTTPGIGLVVSPASSHAQLQLNRATAATGESGLLWATGGATKWWAYMGANDDTRLRFYGGGADRFVIESGGDVGVGTSDPQARLHVAGDARLDGEISSSRLYYVTSHISQTVTDALRDRNGDPITGHWAGNVLCAVTGTNAPGTSQWLVKRQPDATLHIERMASLGSTSSNTPELYNSGGNPRIRLYSHPQTYEVRCRMEQLVP